MSLASVFVDGSTRGRPPRRAHHIVVTDDARGAYFATGGYAGEKSYHHLSFEDGSITRLAALDSTWDLVALTSGGVALVSCVGDSKIALLDLRTGALTTREGAALLGVSRLSPDARWIAVRQRASADRDALRWTDLLRFEDLEVVASIERSHVEAFTGDGRAFVAIDADGVAHGVDLDERTRWRFEGRVMPSVRLDALSAERGGARLLAVVERGGTVLLDAAARTVTAVALGEGATVQDFARGRLILGCAVEGRRRGVAMFDLASGAHRVVDHQSESPVRLSCDGRWALRFATPIFDLHDLEGAESRSWHDGVESTIAALAWSRDGALLASRDEHGGVRVVNPSERALVWRFEGPRGPPGSICFSPDGRALYALSSQGFVTWDLASGDEVRRSTRIKQRASSMAVSGDGRLLAVVGDDYTVRTLDLAGGVRRAMSTTWPSHFAYHVAFSCVLAAMDPQGERVALAYRDGGVEVLALSR